MALLYSYPDEYLAQRVTEDREQRAVKEIEKLYLTIQQNKDSLIVLKAYIITALECSASDDDTFASKYKIYSKEYATALHNAKMQEKENAGKSLYSVVIERN